MILTQEDITEYQDLVRQRHGIVIAKEQALEDALSLIQFVRLTQQPCGQKDDKTTKI